MDTTRFRVRPERSVNLRREDPADTRPFKDKHKAAGQLDRDIARLVSLQEMLYAQDRWSVLLDLPGDGRRRQGQRHQARDERAESAGQRRCISFKRPSDEELDHDYLWRTHKALPERGRIGIFNRSYYEEVLVVRVHPEILAAQKLPPIACHEEHLDRALRRHQRVRALSLAQRHADPEILPARLEGGAAPALPGAAGRTVEELEVRSRAI